jgi:hypothetical protein
MGGRADLTTVKMKISYDLAVEASAILPILKHVRCIWKIL